MYSVISHPPLELRGGMALLICGRAHSQKR